MEKNDVLSGSERFAPNRDLHAGPSKSGPTVCWNSVDTTQKKSTLVSFQSCQRQTSLHVEIVVPGSNILPLMFFPVRHPRQSFAAHRCANWPIYYKKDAVLI